MTRRTKWKVAQDRAALLAHVKNDESDWVRTPEWAYPSDVKALVAAGQLRREVRKEYDHQRGHAANMFGGAGVMVRHRAYLALPVDPLDALVVKGYSY